MRDSAIVEVGMREVAAFCECAEFAYSQVTENAAHDPTKTFFFIHSFLCHCATVQRLAWSEPLAQHAGGRTIAQLLDLPDRYRHDEAKIRAIDDSYDRRLALGLAMRGEVEKILDRNIGDRDAFEQESSIFLHHYDPSVNVATVMEEEIDLGRLSAEIADTRERVSAWLAEHAVLQERAAEITFRPGAEG